MGQPPPGMIPPTPATRQPAGWGAGTYRAELAGPHQGRGTSVGLAPVVGAQPKHTARF